MFFNYCNAICTILLAVGLQPRASRRECSGCSYQHLTTSGCYSVDAPVTLHIQGALSASRRTLAARLKGAGIQLRFFPILLLVKQMDQGRSKGMLQINTCHRAALTSKPLVTVVQRPLLLRDMTWTRKWTGSLFTIKLSQVSEKLQIWFCRDEGKSSKENRERWSKEKQTVHGKGGGFHSFLEKVRKQKIHLSSLYTNEHSQENTWKELYLNVQSQT